MTLKQLIVPFTILVALLTLRVSSYISNNEYYENIKKVITKEIDIISITKNFFGKYNFLIFKEDDDIVSSNEEITKLDDTIFYITTDSDTLISKTSGICVSILKYETGYEITIQNDLLTVIYKEIKSCSIKLYDYIKQEQEIGFLNIKDSYYYVVEYED